MTFSIDQTRSLAQVVLQVLARREHQGRAPRRLLEPDRATWRSFSGNLRVEHLLTLLVEDAAVRFPLPCDPAQVIGPGAPSFLTVPHTTVFGWIQGLSEDLFDASPSVALAHWARTLGLPSRFAGADLYKVQADKRVLELPGTGGQLMMRALDKSPEALLHLNATVLTADWTDRALAGLVAMEADTPNLAHVRQDPDLAWAGSASQRARFDLVFGLQPDKGGAYTASELATRFPAASIVLV